MHKVHLVFVSACLLLSGCAIAIEDNIRKDFSFQNTKAVTVLPFLETRTSLDYYSNKTTSNTSYDYEASDTFEHEILNSKLIVVDRMQLEKVLREHKLSLSGIMQSGDYSSIGNMTSVDLIFTGTVIVDLTSIIINIKAIEVKTGNIVYSSNARTQVLVAGVGSSDKIHDATKQMSKQLMEAIYR